MGQRMGLSKALHLNIKSLAIHSKAQAEVLQLFCPILCGFPHSLLVDIAIFVSNHVPHSTDSPPRDLCMTILKLLRQFVGLLTDLHQAHRHDHGHQIIVEHFHFFSP